MFGPSVEPLVALIAGILILAMPRLLGYIVAIYLINRRYTRPDAAVPGRRIRSSHVMR